MNYKTVANLKDSVSGILQGLNLNNVKNLNIALERAARQLAQKIRLPEAEGRSNVVLYDGIYDYPTPIDIFGSSLIDIQPQGISRNLNDYTYKKYIDQFDRTKAFLPNGIAVSFEFKKGVGIMRLSATRPVPKIELDPMTAIAGWTAGGSASTPVLDSTVFYQEPGSLRFTLTGASIGTLTKTISSQDLTDYLNVGVVFLAMRTPSITNLTSISVKIGSDASNYYSVSNTTGFLGAWTINEWLITAFDLSQATTTGTPVITQIDYAQISIAHSGTITNFYVGDLWISLPSPHTLIYSTAAIFQASGSNPSVSITNTADSILLGDSAYAIYEYESAISVAEQQGGSVASGLINGIHEKLYGVRSRRTGAVIELGLYDLYRADNPSQVIRTIDNYLDE